MNFVGMFEDMESVKPLTEDDYTQSYEPKFQEHAVATMGQEFEAFRTRPVLYNMDGYISPYSSNNWGGTSRIIDTLDDMSRLPPVSDKLDPNRIFSSDINALKTLAADQIRVTRMFEKKLIEGLTEKGKVGLNETDVMAMQALTSARSAVTAINKEQIGIKKNIADIKLKQREKSVVGGGPTNSGNADEGYDNIGKSILDSIFDAPSMPVNANNDNGQFTSANIDQAANVLDGIVGDAVSITTKLEPKKPEVYVVVGDSDDDVEYAAYTADGELVPDYPLPTAKVDMIDRESGIAVNELMVRYSLKRK